MHKAIFVVGSPGVGKTSAVRSLIQGTPERFTHPESGAIKWTFSSPFCLAGHYGLGTFDGADTIPYDGAAPCLKFWREHLLPSGKYAYTIFDGDRFSNSTAQASIESTPGVLALCAYIYAPDEVLDRRRLGRGSDQNPTWMAGRATKARNFADRFKPDDPAFDDMFGGSDSEEKPNRLIEISSSEHSPDEVGRLIKAFADSLK